MTAPKTNREWAFELFKASVYFFPARSWKPSETDECISRFEEILDYRDTVILKAANEKGLTGTPEPVRCAVCGWPLLSEKFGCVPGSCSMRPRPERIYDSAQAEAESQL